MKNNLLKTIAVIAIAVAMLATTVTSFAATATTVTTYNETTGKVHVVSTVENVDPGVMVTYLATKEGTVSTNDDIVYIDQKTSSGSEIKFEYDALNSTSASILYGSNLSAVATELNTNTLKSFTVADVHIAKDLGVKSAVIKHKDADNTVATKLATGEVGTLVIELNAGYEIVSVKIADDNKDVTGGLTFDVVSGQAVEIATVKTVSNVDVASTEFWYVRNAADKSEVLNNKGLVCQITGNAAAVEYGVYAYTTDINKPFELEVGGTAKPGYYPAIGAGSTVDKGYYAVQIATTESLDDVTLVPYYKTADGKYEICQ